MTIGIRTIAIGAVMVVASATEMHAQNVADEACALLPGSPARTQPGRGQWAASCAGLYWPRVAQITFNDLSEFGAIITVAPFDSPAGAKTAAAPTPKESQGARPPRPASYGEGGVEFTETPNANDQAAPTKGEITARRHAYSIEELLTDKGNYALRFSCGRYAVYAYANPSKGIAVRELLTELDAKLKSMNVCGSSNTSVARADPPPPPTEESTGDRTRHFEGNTAREILEANAAGRRYMVVLNRQWDAQQNCFVEERAWAGGIRGTDGTSVVTGLGPSRSICVRGDVVPVWRVNDSQRVLKEAEDNLAKALEQQAALEPYLKDGATIAWATDRNKEIQKWIDYYKLIIANTERGLAQSVP